MNNITPQNQQHSMDKLKNKVSELAAAFLTVDEASEGQRVDNFLTKTLKGVPKSHVYRILRSGEVRVNKKRIDADFRLTIGDVVRVPPVRATIVEHVVSNTPAVSKFEKTIIDSKEKVEILKSSGVKGVMIGRSAINNPQIFNFLKGNKLISSEEIKKEYNELAEKYNAPYRYRKNIMKRIL